MQVASTEELEAMPIAQLDEEIAQLRIEVERRVKVKRRRCLEALKNHETA